MGDDWVGREVPQVLDDQQLLAVRRLCLERRTAIILLMTLSPVSAIGACSSSDSAREVPKVTATADKVKSEWPVGQEWRYRAPWEAPEPLSRDQYELWQDAIRECMAAAGYDYTPVPYVDSSAFFASENPRNEASLRFGYHDLPNQTSDGQPGSSDSSPEFAEALLGASGCANRAREYAFEAVASSAVSPLQDALIQSASQSIEGYAKTTDAQDRLRAWSSCMADGGFKFTSPDDAWQRFSGAGKVSAEELQVRRADFSCDVSVGLTESRSKFEAATFADWLDQNAVAVQQLTDLQSAAAKEVVALRTRLSNEHANALPTIKNTDQPPTASTLPSQG